MCFWHPNPFHTAQNHQQGLPNKFHVTESLNPVCFLCFDHFQWKRDGFQPFYPSYSMVPWSSSSAISPQRLTSLKPKRISCRATELPLPILLLHVLSLAYSSLHSSPLLSFLPDIFFLLWVLYQQWKNCCSFLSPLHQHWFSGCHWHPLICNLLRVSCHFLKSTTPLLCSEAGLWSAYPRWSFILLTWVSFDVWGHLQLSSSFLKLLWCALLILIWCILRSFYVQGEPHKEESLLLLKSNCCQSTLGGCLYKG